MASEESNQVGESTTSQDAETKPKQGSIEHKYVVYDRPIVCILEEKEEASQEQPQQKRRKRCRMFRVIRYKGKALASGGFGVAIATKNKNDNGMEDNSDGKDDEDDDSEEDDSEEDTEHETPKEHETNTEQQPPNDTTKSSEYLFVEEVLFLHEKGLLRALHHNKEPLDMSQLYQWLPKLGVSLASYRVYSHLRSQDFRVLRHDPNRLEILLQQSEHERQQKLRQQAEQASSDATNSKNHPRKHSLKLRRKIRASIQTAVPPTIPANTNTNLQICWDAYNPNSNFGKTRPGLPDFYVASTYYNVPMVGFSDLHALMEQCHGIPLKVATVSDSGT